MATSEADLKNQLADLDWGTGTPVATSTTTGTAVNVEAVTTPPSEGDSLDSLDVGVAGVSAPKTRRTRRGGRAVKIVRGPVAQGLLDATQAGQTVAANAPTTRRGRNTAPDVLTAAGESPAVIALFNTMWKDVGSKLARSVGRPKASRADAAIGWYALLLAMRERDAAK